MERLYTPKNLTKNDMKYLFDVTRRTDIKQCIDDIEKNIRPIDVLINNAGIHKRAPLEDMSLEDGRIVCDIKI